MPNSQIVVTREPAIPPYSYQRLNVIDNGDGTCNIHVEERQNSDTLSNPASIPATGLKVVGSPAGSVSGSGTTDTLPKWTDGPGSVLGDSRITDDGMDIIADSSVGTFQAGDLNNAGNGTTFILNDAAGEIQARASQGVTFASGDGVVRLIATGLISIGDFGSQGNGTLFELDDTNQLIRINQGGGSRLVINESESTLRSGAISGIGDTDGNFNNTWLIVNDAAEIIAFNAVNGVSVSDNLNAETYSVGGVPGVDATVIIPTAGTLTFVKGILTDFS